MPNSKRNSALFPIATSEIREEQENTGEGGCPTEAYPKKLELRDTLRSEVRAETERDFKNFVHLAWPILEPATKLEWNWHLDLLCEYLTAVQCGNVRRLIINVPPRSMKSLLCTVLYPVWRWCTTPQRRFMFVSYSEQLSTEHSVLRRNVLSSDWYQGHWGEVVRFAKDQNVKTHYRNARRGAMFATSIGGTATGKGCDELIVDDPMSAQCVFSDQERQTVIRNFSSTFRSRLNDPAKGSIVVIMQRLHVDDLSGHLLTEEPGAWTHVSLPAEFDQNVSYWLPLSETSVTRHAGELLWESRFPRSVLEHLKTALGSWAYTGQYLQAPTPIDGAIIKREWLMYYDELPSPGERAMQWVQSWDCSFKDKHGSDYVVGQVWLRVGGRFYLVDQVRARMDFIATTQAIEQMTARYPQAAAKLIEDAANGPAVIAALRSKISGILAITPDGPKIGRVNSVSPYFEARNVHLPAPSVKPWVGAFVEELTSFPGGSHDDQVDACTQALKYLHGPDSGIWQFVRNEAEKKKQ